MVKYAVKCLLSGDEKPEEFFIKAKNIARAKRWLYRNFHIQKILEIKQAQEKEAVSV